MDHDKYRSYLHGEGEKNTKWRFGAPPNYDVVNKLFEEGRTKVCLSLSLSLFLIHVCVISIYKRYHHICLIYLISDNQVMID
jgi:hypothetical protein